MNSVRQPADLDKFFSGSEIYGDDLPEDELLKWYVDEKEAYASMYVTTPTSYRYPYHALNWHHALRFLNDERFENALGIGSAFGDEFEPIAGKIEQLTIVESSRTYNNDAKLLKNAKIIEPGRLGALPLPDSNFDLVFCLSVLHHLPNISFVANEISRVLKPGGLFISREPIVSMGDWRHPRRGLTPRERGLPLAPFLVALRKAGLTQVRQSYCVFGGFERVCRVFSITSPYSSRVLVNLDAALCRMFRWNSVYHSTSAFRKLRPTATYLTCRKQP